MPTRNYYVILGVSRHESAAGIRGVFRDLMRRYHLARTGPVTDRQLEAVVEAYRVLSDPERRASYDRGLQPVEPGGASAPDRPAGGSAHRRRRRPAEPLTADPVSLLRDFHVTRPSVDAVLERFRSNFLPHRRAPQGIDALRLEVVIGPEQAAAGGTLSLGVPVFFPCRRCAGTGRFMAYRCTACRGSGLREEEQPARVFVPPLVRDGTTFQVPLASLGIRNMYLEVRVRVAS